MSIFSTIVKALTATGVLSGAAGVGSKIYLKNGHGFGTMDVILKTDETTQQSPTVTQEEQAAERTNTPRTYGTELTKKSFTLVNESTEDSIILNIMMERLDPTKANLTYGSGQRFKTSSQVVFGHKTFTSTVGNSNYSLTVLQKPNVSYVAAWKTACVTALNTVVTAEVETRNSQEYNELARLREWCTVPKVDDVLKRHKFKPLSTTDEKDDAKWKEVIAGGWFKKENNKNNWEDQSFIDGEDLDKVIGANKEGIKDKESITKEQIDVFKNKCKAVLGQAFVRDNFYLTTQFIKGMSSDTTKPTIDPFQEAALFCVEPMTATTYITGSLQGSESADIVVANTDYCYLTDNQRETWTTNNPLGGKSFWCAVKALYKNR
ncbi:hypothetical protein, partial [Candidatus Mycoplasma haematohominis]|uniref:hypothetical protein n=1 Tax=Candidatus Mycoplasma haematohominis TaxID=1494318 RepID=UPI001C0A767B